MKFNRAKGKGSKKATSYPHWKTYSTFLDVDYMRPIVRLVESNAGAQ